MLSSDDVETHTREGGFDLCGIAPAEAFPELRFTPRNCTARRLAVTKIAYQGFLFEFSRIVCRRLRCHTRRPSRDRRSAGRSSLTGPAKVLQQTS